MRYLKLYGAFKALERGNQQPRVEIEIDIDQVLKMDQNRKGFEVVQLLR